MVIDFSLACFLTDIVFTAGFQRVLSQLQQRAPGQSISPEILPAPRGLDPRLVAWRGGVVWTRLDSMQDIWIRREEWDELGMRSVKMRMM